MPSCTPKIRLDGPPTVSLGDTVRGAVVIDVDGDVRANAVHVELSWRTHGRGDVDSELVADRALPGGAWSSGQLVEIPFDVTLPRDGPLTTRGELVNLDWYVRARVDLSWATDPSTEIDLLVDAGGAPPPLVLKGADAPASVGANIVGPLILTVFLVPFIVVSPTWLEPMRDAIRSGHIGAMLFALPFVFGGVMFAGVPGLVLYKTWHTYLGHRFLAGARVTLEPSPAEAGDSVRVRLELARNADRVEQATAVFRGQERARYRQGTDTRTATHEIHKADVALQRQGDAWVGRASVPLDARTSLSTGNNHIEWRVEVKAVVRGAPDPTFSAPLHVRGRRERPELA
jgi:hypothetical protein